MLMFEGVYTALVTPFDSNNNINYQKLEDLIELQISKGVNGLVIGGTTGEGMLINDILSYYEKVIKIVDNRLKIILSISSFKKEELDTKIQILNDFDFDAYLINTPYYLTTSQRGIFKYYEYINSIVNKPFIVYYNPLRSNQYITLKTWDEFKKLNNFIGVKDASLNYKYSTRLMKIMKDHSYLTGNDSMFYIHLTLGTKGIISSLSNVYPELFVKLYFLSKNNEFELASKMFKKYESLMNVLYIEPNPIGLKYFMNYLGYDVGSVKFPLVEYSKENKMKLISHYKELINENTNNW